MKQAVNQLLISEHSLLEFAQASGDRNPLHTSAEYARQTPFGRPVVHGALGLLAACAHSGVNLNAVSDVSVRFNAPLYLDIPYSLQISGTPSSRVLSLFDGSRSLFIAQLTRGQDHQVFVAADAPNFPVTEPRKELPPTGGDIYFGPYWPDVPRIARLLTNADSGGVPDWLIIKVAAASFTVGMVFPGENALLRSLQIARPHSLEGPVFITVSAPTSTSVSRGLARIKATVVGSSTHSSFTATASIRQSKSSSKQPEREPSLSGKSALIVGASRGLGAALRNELVARGSRTWTLQRTPAPNQWHSLETVISTDASDRSRVEHVRDTVKAETESLDLLVLNATSALEAMWLDEAHLDRISKYIQHEIHLMLTPLITLGPTIRPGGVCAFVSSEILRSGDDGRISMDAVEWPHYAAAKAAGEALMEVAALEYPTVRFVIAQLPPLDTQLTVRTAVQPGLSTESIAAELIDSWTSGRSSPYDVKARQPAQDSN